jgi:ribonuclease Z
MVSAAILDHRIPCLALSIKEDFHVNIKKSALDALGLQPGPWINDFKQALFAELPMDTTFRFISNGKSHAFELGRLAEDIALITPGQKITYVVDAVYSRSNSDAIVDLARDSDHLFIEAAFLEKHAHIAADKYHLTARQAGHLASASGAKRFTLLHHSPRYTDQADRFRLEAERAYLEYSKNNQL